MPAEETDWSRRLCIACRLKPRKKRTGKRWKKVPRFCKRCKDPLEREKKWCLACLPEAKHRRALRKTFGLPPEEYDRMLTAQAGICAICSAKPNGKRLSVDHDHSTGRVRGLLCGLCNFALGAFRDNPDTMAAAIRYLKADL